MKTHDKQIRKALKQYCKAMKKRKTPREDIHIIRSRVKVDKYGRIIEFEFLD